jgi:ribosomal protein S18 acetylase RimI-like enzyme
MDPHPPGTAGVLVRVATPADVEPLAALVNSAYRGDSSREGWTTEADLLGGSRIDHARMLAAITTDSQVVLVQDDGGEVVGCVHLQRTGANCYLGMLTTKPTRQNEGLGRRMIAAAEAWAVEHWRSVEMHMTVIVQRPELIAWYERRGYAKTGTIKPFPYGDERWGLPQRTDLAFHVLAKPLA